MKEEFEKINKKWKRLMALNEWCNKGLLSCKTNNVESVVLHCKALGSTEGIDYSLTADDLATIACLTADRATVLKREMREKLKAMKAELAECKKIVEETSQKESEDEE